MTHGLALAQTPEPETPTASATVTVTATPTRVPTATPRIVRIEIGSAGGGPGDAVAITVSLHTAGLGVAATANDISFETPVLDLDPAACRVNAAIRKSILASLVRVGDVRDTVRVLVQSTQNTDAIADGPLYTCTVRISTFALPGTYRLVSDLALAYSPAGTQLGPVSGTGGTVTVSLVGRACTGDCSHDGAVTVDELVSGVNIALGNRPLDDCPSFDANGDGEVTVDEIVTGVSNALTGCVTPPTPLPTPTPTETAPPTPLYVRVSGDDANTGTDPAHALRTITQAARRAQDGYWIVVGPGTYREGVTTATSGRAPQGLVFVADASGLQTADPPGPVIVDATDSSAGAGFKLANSAASVIDGFTITGAVDGGIVIKSGSDNFTVQNCIVFDNPGVGIRVQDSANVLIFNNLVYGNGAMGVGIVGQGAGSPNARLFSNTIFGNGDRGCTIGTSGAASPGALLRNNIVQGNGGRTDPPLQNIKVFTSAPSHIGFDGDFDLVFPPTYLPASITGQHDIGTDAAFNFSAGGDFHLRPNSPAIDAGDMLPPHLEAILYARTATGESIESGRLDLGFHYPP